MWYPEEPATFCRHCSAEVPADCFWRGRGFIITGGGQEVRTTVLYSLCPGCGRRLSAGLDGPLWHRVLYSWLWKLRYPYTRPPRVETPPHAELRPERRRAANE
jgi:hypothetical protein